MNENKITTSCDTSSFPDDAVGGKDDSIGPSTGPGTRNDARNDANKTFDAEAISFNNQNVLSTLLKVQNNLRGTINPNSRYMRVLNSNVERAKRKVFSDLYKLEKIFDNPTAEIYYKKIYEHAKIQLGKFLNDDFKRYKNIYFIGTKRLVDLEVTGMVTNKILST